MNYSFENKIDKSYFKEFHSSRKIVKSGILYITFFLSILFLILSVAIKEENDFAIISSMFMGVFALFGVLKLPFYISDKMTIKNYFNRMLKEVITISDDYIHILSKTTDNEVHESNVKYEDIVSFTELENLIIMTCVAGHIYLISKRSLNNIPALAHLKNKCFGKIKFNEYSENKIHSFYIDKDEKYNDSHNITYRYTEKAVKFQNKTVAKQYLFIIFFLLFAFALFLTLQIIFKTSILLPLTVFFGVNFLIFILFIVNFLKGNNVRKFFFNYIHNMKIDEDNIYITSYANNSVYKSLLKYQNIISISLFEDDIVIMRKNKSYYYINKEFYNDEFLNNLQNYYKSNTIVKK